MTRRALRELQISAPSWSDEPVSLREPTVQVWRTLAGTTDDQERTIKLLGLMVLDDDGNPVGVDAILQAPLAALAELSAHVPELLGQGPRADPLTETSDSPTGSPSPSEG